MLTLGIPGSGTTAILLIALAALDVQAGPLLFIQRPDIVWGLIAALYIGNVMLLIRQSMIMTQGDVLRMVERPIVAVFLVLAVAAMAAPILLRRLRFRGKPVEIEREEA